MAIVVQKYGGTSVAGPDEIKRVARRVVETADRGNKVCVVVSAMGHTTDQLIELAHQVSADPHPREQDMLLTAGERISVALVSMAIIDLGRDAVSFTGSQAGIVTDTSHGRARIVEMRRGRVHEALEAGQIAIVAGFQGVSTARDVTISAERRRAGAGATANAASDGPPGRWVMTASDGRKAGDLGRFCLTVRSSFVCCPKAANCEPGEFTNFVGEKYQFKGKSSQSDFTGSEKPNVRHWDKADELHRHRDVSF